MIGSALVPTRRGLKRAAGPRQQQRIIRIGGNPVKLPKTRGGSPLRAFAGGFHPAIETNRFTTTASLLVQKPSGFQLDLSSRLVSFDLNWSINDSMGSGQIRLARGSGTNSLSPGMTGGLVDDFPGFPVLDPGVEVVLSLTADDPSSPGSGGAVVIFHGLIDRTVGNSGPGLVQINCRDWGSRYQNVSVLQGKYGGQEASLTMGDILVRHGFSDTELLSLAPDDWIVEEYPGRDVGVLDALRAIAQQAGRDVRYFNSVGKLVYYEPDRVTIDADIYLGPNRYEEISDYSVGNEDVRSYWDVYYRDANGSVHGPSTAFDDATKDRYFGGRHRKSRIILDRADNIRNDPDAQRYANAALADTKEALANFGIRAPALPQIELNDIIGLLPDDDITDSTAWTAATTIHHSYANGHMTSTIGGRPARLAAYRDYRRSTTPDVIVSTELPVEGDYAKENMIHAVVPDLLFPT